MPRKIVTLFDRRYSPARSRSRIGERIYPKPSAAMGSLWNPHFFNFDALAQRLPRPHNRHRNPGLRP